MLEAQPQSFGRVHVGADGPQAQAAVPLSGAQLGIWFAQQIDPASPSYNIGEYIEIHGPIDPELFDRALELVVAEAESLRIELVETEDGPRQVTGVQPAWSMPVIDVSAEKSPRTAAETWMKADLARPIELTHGPLFAYALFKAAPDRFFWYARYHHIVMDGFGMSLIARRLAEIYTALRNGNGAHDRPFGSLARLLEEDAEYRVSKRFKHDREFWSEYLSDPPEPMSLSDRNPTRARSFLRQSAYLDAPSVERLCKIADRGRADLPPVIIAAVASFFHRLTAATDVVLSIPVRARDTESRNIPGMVSNVLPLRLAARSTMTMSELVRNVAQEIRRGLEHQHFRTADLRRNFQHVVDGRTMYGPTVNVMRFDYDIDFAGYRGINFNLSLGPVEDLSIQVYDRLDGGGIRIDFDANPELYGVEALAGHQQRFLRWLAAAAAAPDQPIGRLDILAPEERRRILTQWNDTAYAVAPATLPELFAAQGARTPDAIAAVFEEQSLT